MFIKSKLSLSLSFFLFIFSHLIVAQETNNNNNNNNNRQCTANGDNTAGCIDTANTQFCVGVDNVDPGGFLFLSPTVGSVAAVGTSMNITWNYTQTTNRQRYPARGVTVLYAASNSVGQSDPWKTVVENLNNTQTYFWNVPALSDGQYTLRILADGIDPSRTSTTNCIPEGFPLPAVSSRFRIINANPLVSEPDPFPPNDASHLTVTFGVFGISLILSLIIVV